MLNPNSKSGGAIIPENTHRFDIKLLHPKWWVTWLIILLVTVFWFIPRRLRDKIASQLSLMYMKKQSNHRFYAEVNLDLCFPKLSTKEKYLLLSEHFKSFFQVMLDAPLFWWGTDRMIRKRVEVTGFEKASRLISAKKSVIFLVSHSTALDVCVTTFSMMRQMQGFYKPFKDPVVDWLMFRSRTKRGSRLAARGEGFGTVVRDLKKGVPLVYLSDEDLGRQGSVFAPFFGVKKATLAMLPRIVKMTDATVFPVYTHYIQADGKYLISILPALQGYPEGEPVNDARKLNEATENTIMICPEQYLWKLRLFKTTESKGKLNPYKKAKQRNELS